MNVGFRMKNKLGVSINFIILKIWSLCVAQLLQKVMTYLLETFKCLNKLLFFLGMYVLGESTLWASHFSPKKSDV
jgi:hypothetical protein